MVTAEDAFKTWCKAMHVKVEDQEPKTITTTGTSVETALLPTKIIAKKKGKKNGN